MEVVAQVPSITAGRAISFSRSVYDFFHLSLAFSVPEVPQLGF